MQFVSQTIALVNYTQNPEATIEFCGRVAWQSFDKMDEGSSAKFIDMLMRKGHTSVLEHVSATFVMTVPRLCTHQIVRHRIASYTEMSQRYVKLVSTKEDTDSDIRFIMPFWFRNEIKPILLDRAIKGITLDGDGSLQSSESTFLNVFITCRTEADQDETFPLQVTRLEWQFIRRLLDNEQLYTDITQDVKLTSTHIKPQEAAREVLPEITATEIVMTMNFRSWLNFINLRDTKHASPYIHGIASGIKSELAKLAPTVFGDKDTVQIVEDDTTAE